jgi:hypothetical protein
MNSINKICGRVILSLAIIFIVGSCSNDPSEKLNKTPDVPKIYEKVSSESSGIDFSNAITENFNTDDNLMRFDYFYNGAGLAVVDINNDGLEDLFFCGNQVPNRLYLNKGNLEFEDISDKAGINSGKNWSNGVSVVDINNDGWMDIYVAQGGARAELDRKNCLYINNGDLTFTNKASKYGLDDMGVSMQSVFFDYDKDGDLDCFVLNESNRYSRNLPRFMEFFEKNPEEKYLASCHLFRNEGDRFVDISEEAGILNPAFGLGVVVSDFNGDSWPDIYVANDYYVPDALYINTTRGKFRDEIKKRTNHTSYFSMGADYQDINNDGYQDLYVVDMAADDHYRSKTLMASMNPRMFEVMTDYFGFQSQYMFNVLQVNQGTNKFSEVAHLSGVAQTDWSWAGLIDDLDNDGLRDIYVTNGFRRYGLDNDFQTMADSVRDANDGIIEGEVLKELYAKMPTEKLVNMAFHNVGDLQFEHAEKDWGLEYPSYSNGAATVDLDNDGDLDIIVNNMDEEAFHNSEDLAKVTLRYNGNIQVAENRRVRGYLSSLSPIIHFGLGKNEVIDTLTVKWYSGEEQTLYGIQTNQLLELSKADATVKRKFVRDIKKQFYRRFPASRVGLTYRHLENKFNDFEKEILLPQKQSTLGPHIQSVDINGDPYPDLFAGGAAGQPANLFLQHSGRMLKAIPPSFAKDSKYEDMEALIFDIEGDGDQDIYIVSGGNEEEEGSDFYADRLYRNDGEGNLVRDETFIDNLKVSGKCVKGIDFDRDGDLDVMVGNRIIPQKYPLPAKSVFYLNDKGSLKDITEQVFGSDFRHNIVNDISVSDFNLDGLEDLILVGEWSHLKFMQNNGDGTFTDVSEKVGVSEHSGWWFCIEQVNINNDDYPDYVIGNLGLNSKFKATYKKPFWVYANDMDENGTLDIVLSKKYKDEYVPVIGRECSSEQMPFIKDKFPTYDAFASATLEDIYGEKLSTSNSFMVNQLQSAVLLSDGKGGYDFSVLPVEGQVSPILDILVTDVDDDGVEDIIAVGNIFNTEVETPRYDAEGIVVFLIKEGKLVPVKSGRSGLDSNANIKSLALLSSGNQSDSKELLLVATNNGFIELYSK